MAHPDRFLMAGVMGWPVMHSRSPKLHNYWLAKHGLVGTYVPLAIKAEGLEAALRALPALGFSGCNLTIPHKEAAFAIVDRVDPAAKRIGAINCVVVEADGSLDGRNNDGFGYIHSILDADPNWRADAGPIVVIGAGGGARAVLVGLAERGAKEIRVINRTFERAKTLEAELGQPIRAYAWADRADALDGVAMLVNTTSQGMAGQPALELTLDRLPRTALVSDIVYIPKETPLLEAARKRGNKTVNGLGMLLNQARPAFHAWFGVMPEVTAELRAMIEATI
ncbi:MAG: shikimate dehydrogenase [Proteobacteria bacterium]|nr:shikimate dehydrogenase [Pseudomonadota bacterium]MBI3498243.1 shikimate dehydrogenase [Pseudomonadota bacterium]